MLDLQIKLTGSEKIVRELAEKRAKLTNYKDYFEEYAAPAMFARFNKIFELRGGVGGFSRWKRLRPITILLKKQRGLSLKTLQATGTLRRAYTRRGSGNELKITKDSMTYRNLIGYGAAHETGTERIPKRSVVERILAYKAFRTDLRKGLLAHFDVEGQ